MTQNGRNDDDRSDAGSRRDEQARAQEGGGWGSGNTTGQAGQWQPAGSRQPSSGSGWQQGGSGEGGYHDYGQRDSQSDRSWSTGSDRGQGGSFGDLRNERRSESGYDSMGNQREQGAAWNRDAWGSGDWLGQGRGGQDWSREQRSSGSGSQWGSGQRGFERSQGRDQSYRAHRGHDYDRGGSQDFSSFTGDDYGGRDFAARGGTYPGGYASSESYRPSYGIGSGSSGGMGTASRSGFDRSGRDYDDWRSYGEQRGFLDRAGDEIASWFGDEDAARRREQDHRRSERADDHRGRGPSNYTRSDDRIREDANEALTRDPLVDASHITVTVSGGELTLDGRVDNRQAKRRAEDAVDDLPGVRHVQNNLRVESGSSSAYSGGMTGSSTGTSTTASATGLGRDSSTTAGSSATAGGTATGSTGSSTGSTLGSSTTGSGKTS